MNFETERKCTKCNKVLQTHEVYCEVCGTLTGEYPKDAIIRPDKIFAIVTFLAIFSMAMVLGGFLLQVRCQTLMSKIMLLLAFISTVSVVSVLIVFLKLKGTQENLYNKKEYCKYCKAKLNQSSNYCYFCGAKI